MIKMIIVYTTKSCESCRNTIAFMALHRIPHIEQNMKYNPMSKREFLQLIALTANAKEVVASNHLQLHEELIESMRLSELHAWLNADKRRFKRPIIVDFERGLLQFGFHREDLFVFMSKRQRNAYRKTMRLEDYKWYD